MIGFQSSRSNRWPPSCSRKDKPPEIVAALYEMAMKKPGHTLSHTGASASMTSTPYRYIPASRGPHLLTAWVYSISLANVSARNAIANFIRQPFSAGWILLLFVLLIVFCPEPAQPAPDDCLPSPVNRIANIKAARSFGPIRGERADALKLALAIRGVAFTALFQRLFVLVEPSQYSFQQFFTGYRSVRGPPHQPR